MPFFGLRDSNASVGNRQKKVRVVSMFKATNCRTLYSKLTVPRAGKEEGIVIGTDEVCYPDIVR